MVADKRGKGRNRASFFVRVRGLLSPGVGRVGALTATLFFVSA